MNKGQKLTAPSAEELENQCKILQQKLDALTVSEKRLGMLNAISATLYGSLELPGVFHKAARMVSELMSADITLLYIAEETTQVLQLVASEGISPESVLEIKKLKAGEGYMRGSGQNRAGFDR
jgi:signal transduction protein with GAF and PtsI domain